MLYIDGIPPMMLRMDPSMAQQWRTRLGRTSPTEPLAEWMGARDVEFEFD